MLSHVLVPLDGSALAESALDYAREIVKENGKVTLLSIVQIPEYPIYDMYAVPASLSPAYNATIEQLIPNARDYLNKVAERLANESKLDVHVQVETGEAATVICDIADHTGASAIVMSTHGRSGLGRWFFGSVTSKVLMGAHCPVMVVPKRNKTKTDEVPKVKA